MQTDSPTLYLARARALSLSLSLSLSPHNALNHTIYQLLVCLTHWAALPAAADARAAPDSSLLAAEKCGFGSTRQSLGRLRQPLRRRRAREDICENNKRKRRCVRTAPGAASASTSRTGIKTSKIKNQPSSSLLRFLVSLLARSLSPH